MYPQTLCLCDESLSCFNLFTQVELHWGYCDVIVPIRRCTCSAVQMTMHAGKFQIHATPLVEGYQSTEKRSASQKV